MGAAGLRSDAELVQAARGGAKDSFAELVSRHWAMAESLTTRLLGSADLARDVMQETTIAAMVGLDRLRSPDRFGAWFCGIALNVGRRWMRQLHAEIPGAPVERTATDPGPDEHAELAELAAAVRGAVAELADGQRHAVTLFYLQGLSHREVAAELAISVGAVKARLHQGRAALLPRLTPLLDNDPVDIDKEPAMTPAPRPAWVTVSVAEVRRDDTVDPARPLHVMVLQELAGPRRVPIWIGPAEAAALALSLESQETPRPLAYQLTAALLAATAGRVVEVKITKLTATVFYAVIVVDTPSGPREVDARPSDAVNLALVTGAAILVGTELLDDPDVTGRSDWARYPTGTTEVAEDALQWITRTPCP